ncbi:hypothetical protein WDW37_02540 [Bdellovibrionota bacterium FG-1]
MTTKKHPLLWGCTLLGFAAGTLLWMGHNAQAETLGFSLSQARPPGAALDDLAVLVLDEENGLPLSDAKITLADTLKDEDSAARGITGQDGTLLFRGALTRHPALTVSREGFSTLSLVGIQSPQLTVYLKPLPLTEWVTFSGQMTGWAPRPNSDVISAGLVFKSLSVFDLIHFDASSFISPLKDTIDVFGSHEIPSNLILPEQDISIFFGSITLNKPTYRLPILKNRSIRLATVQGTIATTDVLAMIQGGGKLSLNLLNKLKFQRSGLSDVVTTEGDRSIDVNAAFRLRPCHRVSVKNPPFEADVIVAAVTDIHGDREILMPTDIKLARSSDHPDQNRTVSLSSADSSIGKTHDVVTIAQSGKGRRLSGIVTQNAGADVNPGDFLTTEERPDAPSIPDWISVPALSTGVSAVVYQAQTIPLWYVFVLPGAGQTQVPAQRGLGLEKATSYSVMSLDFGPGFDNGSLDGQTIMQGLQRFSRAGAHIGENSSPLN